MRSVVLLGLVLDACAPVVLPHAEPLAVVLPPVPRSAAPVASIPPTDLEPDVAPGGCVIAGTALSLASESVEVCGAPSRACFGRLSQSMFGKIDSLRVAPGESPEARLVVSSNGVLVVGVVAARSLSPHPAQVSLVDGFYVPQWAGLTIVSAGDNTATLTIDPGEDVKPAAPLVVEWPCSRLSSDSPVIAPDDVQRSLGLGQPTDTLVAPTGGSLPLRARSNGAVVATVAAQGQPAPVYDRSGPRVRVLLGVDGGYVVGWVDRSGLLKPYAGGHHVHAPHIRMGETRYGFRCTHDVPVFVRVATDTVHAATILAGTPFDPADGASVLVSGGVVLDAGVEATIRPEDVADCHE